MNVEAYDGYEKTPINQDMYMCIAIKDAAAVLLSQIKENKKRRITTYAGRRKHNISNRRASKHMERYITLKQFNPVLIHMGQG
jgi:hypothetical protein